MGCCSRYVSLSIIFIRIDTNSENVFVLCISEGGSISEKLREVTVPIMSNVDCRKSSYGASRITDNMLCAGFARGGKDSCQVIFSCWYEYSTNMRLNRSRAHIFIQFNRVTLEVHCMCTITLWCIWLALWVGAKVVRNQTIQASMRKYSAIQFRIDWCLIYRCFFFYSRVNRYKTWISSNTVDACYCDENPVKK